MSHQDGKTVRWQSRLSVENDAVVAILPASANLDNSDFAALPLVEREKGSTKCDRDGLPARWQ